MTKITVFAIVILVFSIPAQAMLMHGGGTSGFVGCSNSLIFSSACNSQYLAVIQ